MPYLTLAVAVGLRDKTIAARRAHGSYNNNRSLVITSIAAILLGLVNILSAAKAGGLNIYNGLMIARPTLACAKTFSTILIIRLSRFIIRARHSRY